MFEGLPTQFKQYFDIVQKLEFDESPNYNKLRRIMKELFLDKGYSYNFDWQADDIDDQENASEVTKDTSIVNQFDEDTTRKLENVAQSQEIDITARLNQC